MTQGFQRLGEGGLNRGEGACSGQNPAAAHCSGPTPSRCCPLRRGQNGPTQAGTLREADTWAESRLLSPMSADGGGVGNRSASCSVLQ